MKLIIGFSKPKNHPFPILSWLIRWIQSSEYSHTYVRWFDDNMQEDLIFEAHAKNVQVTKFFNRLKYIEPVKEFMIEISPMKYTQFLKVMWDLTGHHYGALQLVGMAYEIIVYKLFKRKIANPLGDKRKTLVCSEAVGYILQDVLGVKISKSLDKLTPVDVYKLTEEYVKTH